MSGVKNEGGGEGTTDSRRASPCVCGWGGGPNPPYSINLAVSSNQFGWGGAWQVQDFLGGMSPAVYDIVRYLADIKGLLKMEYEDAVRPAFPISLSLSLSPLSISGSSTSEALELSSLSRPAKRSFDSSLRGLAPRHTGRGGRLCMV